MLELHTGTVDDAVAFVIRRAMTGPINVVLEKHLDGGRVGVTVGAIYVSSEVHGAILGLVADSRLRPDEQQPAARLRGLEG